MTQKTTGGSSIPQREVSAHYNGNEIRTLFVIGAVLLLIGESVGAIFPFSTSVTVAIVAILVIAAGITNPVQGWIHWLNALISFAGTIFFGITALEYYRLGARLLNPTFVFIELFALISLLSLYLTTKTIRGFYLREIKSFF